jgi:hypothetical protein|tara:strand:- start:43 stop:657 length:615 start_codon:yes stop_codon:yes gene_type:complete
MNGQTSGKNPRPNISKNIGIKSLLERKTLNMIFYDNSFTKTTFFVKIMSEQNIPIFYFDFDLLYSGYLSAKETLLPKNTTVFSLNNSNLYENFKLIINKVSKTKSLIILDSLNGFFNLIGAKNDVARTINSLIMLLVSAASTVKSCVIVGSLSKLNNEKIWVLQNNGRHIIENDYMTKIQLISSENTTVVKTLNSDNSDLILEI